MVINKGGNKGKRKGRKHFRTKTFSLDDLRASKSDNQEYGYITEKYGDGRYNISCYDKVQRLGITRGSLRNKNRLLKGSLVLLSLRDYEDAKCDILYNYSDDDKDKLISAKVLEESFIKTGKLSNEDHKEKDVTSISNPTPIILDTQSNGSDTAWASDGSTKDTGENVNDIQDTIDLCDEINIDDL